MSAIKLLENPLQLTTTDQTKSSHGVHLEKSRLEARQMNSNYSRYQDNSPSNY